MTQIAFVPHNLILQISRHTGNNIQYLFYRCIRSEAVAFGEAVKAEKSSDMSARGAPDIERKILRFDVLFVKNLSEEKPPAKLVE